jgi:hypothetical protein
MVKKEWYAETSKIISSSGSSILIADVCPSFSTPKNTLLDEPSPIRARLLKLLVISFSSSMEMVDTTSGRILSAFTLLVSSELVPALAENEIKIKYEKLPRKFRLLVVLCSTMNIYR